MRPAGGLYAVRRDPRSARGGTGGRRSVPTARRQPRFYGSAGPRCRRVTTLLALGSIAWLADEPARAVGCTRGGARARAIRQRRPDSRRAPCGTSAAHTGSQDDGTMPTELREQAVDLASSAGDREEHALAPRVARQPSYALGGWHPSAIELSRRRRSKPRAQRARTRRSRAATISLGLSTGLAGDPERLRPDRRGAPACRRSRRRPTSRCAAMSTGCSSPRSRATTRRPTSSSPRRRTSSRTACS